ncbi:MAG TPA: valine--tRNA ligase [Tepidisphaeraceae bacterium]|jgi:valyl-tRNA synthetase
MTTDLAKTYEPAAVEAQAYRVWMEEKAFEADPAAPGEPYCIVIPPPNVTGALHLGHAINNTLQDILIRKHRMAGFNTLWVPGIDHAGIATQAVVEKQLKENENKTRHDVGREGEGGLVERIWKWKEQYGDRIIEQLKRLGCSCDWSRTRFTLDPGLAAAVRETFFRLFKDGLIYRGKRLVNWDTHLQTSISDDEIYYETVKTSLWHIRYPIVDARSTGFQPVPNRAESQSGSTSQAGAAGHGLETHATFMVVATTRPETMLGDTAVAVHSADPRWNWAIGKFVELPLTGRRIPIIADDILVDPKFGTGVVKVTPAHDPNDYAVWQRHKGKSDEIDLINILTPEGKINEAAPPKYTGLFRAQARKQVVADLEHAGLLEREEPYETQVGHSDRSKTPVEPYLSDQWFVHMAPLAEPALEAVRKGLIEFFPERHAQQYLAWLGEKRDWPISRQLWWGHRIPVWRWALKMKPGERKPIPDSHVEPDTAENPEGFPFNECAAQSVFDSGTGEWINYCCPPPNRTDLEAALEQAGYIQDEDVLDTWFSSALWPFSTLGWPEQTADLAKYYPTSVLLTGRDIITLWVARMVMVGMYDMGSRSTGFQPVPDSAAAQTGADSQTDADGHGLKTRATAKQLGLPFSHVAINPTILDGKGERMSKSKGNGVDPVDIIDTHGADALRFTMTTMATETQDVRMPVVKDAQGRNTSKKFDEGRNFCNKLWNAARFALSNLEGVATEAVDETRWSMADRWIVSRFNRTVDTANKALEIYRFDQYAKACYDFFWGDFCDWYLETIKPAMKDPARAGQTANVLAAVLDGALRLMHPMIPFITETIWWRLCEIRAERGLPGRIMGCMSNRLILAAWPLVGDFSHAAEHIFPRLQEIIVAIRNVRNEYKVDVKKPVAVSILAPGDSARQIESNREMIELLATCTIAAASGELKPLENAIRVSAAGCDIFIEGLVDADTEKQRVAKKCEELKKQIAALRSRLANEAYISKAPPHLVQQTKDQLAAAESEAQKLGCGVE